MARKDLPDRKAMPVRKDRKARRANKDSPDQRVLPVRPAPPACIRCGNSPAPATIAI
jgi:hypothetical protein